MGADVVVLPLDEVILLLTTAVPFDKGVVVVASTDDDS